MAYRRRATACFAASQYKGDPRMSLITEFKEFAMKGNVLDMAVGVVIGAAFGKIVSSLVGDVITPALGKVVGGVDFKDLAVSLGTDPAGQEILVKYGVFLQSIFDFLIVALAIFMAIKAINRLKRPPPPAADPAPAPDVVLLTEIRDLLKQK
jgi:large conductance mechanosensitive channel